MSFPLEKLVRGIHKDELEGGEYHVALALAYRADDTGYCYPSLLLIAQDAHFTERTVVRALQRFTGAWSKEDARALITKGSHRNPGSKSGGRNNVSSYQFNLALLEVLNDKAAAKPGWVQTKDRNTDNHATAELEATPTTTTTNTDNDATMQSVNTDNHAVTSALNTDNHAIETLTSVHETPTLTPVNTDNDASYIGRTEKELSLGTGRGNSQGARLRKEAKNFAIGILEKAKQLSPEALGELAVEIAIRHPRSRMRRWTSRNVSQADTSAILFAMEEEAQLSQVDMAEAGRMMLGLLDAWDDVPQEKWQYVAAIPRFYQQGDYRLQPHELPGIGQQEGRKHGTGTRSSSRGTEGNADVLRAFVERGEVASRHEAPVGDSGLVGRIGAVVRPEDHADDGGSVPSEPERTDGGADRPSLFPRSGRVQVLPRPRYPARVQWPTRNG